MHTEKYKNNVKMQTVQEGVGGGVDLFRSTEHKL